MKYPDAAILQFAKEPVPGRVKTRLIPALGEEGACCLHKQLLDQSLNMAVAANLCPVELWVASDGRAPHCKSLASTYQIELCHQEGEDLGERMGAAARQALVSGRDYVLIIGSDCPAMTPDHLDIALEQLRQGQDAVIIPAEDGGYVLIGLRRSDAELFQGIDWGTDAVLKQTREALRDLGWRWHESAPLWDIDRPEDLDRLSKQVVRVVGS